MPVYSSFGWTLPWLACRAAFGLIREVEEEQWRSLHIYEIALI